NPVLEAVVVEDVGEACGDHAPDAEIGERPGSMLAGRAAAEIVARDQDLRVAVRSLVEHEIRILRSVLAVAQAGEKADPEAGAPDRLQILLRDDHVGVDIDDPQRRGDALQLCKLVHRRPIPSTRGPLPCVISKPDPSRQTSRGVRAAANARLPKLAMRDTRRRGSITWINWFCFFYSAPR